MGLHIDSFSNNVPINSGNQHQPSSIIIIIFINNRAVFNWVSKAIHVLLWFCFTSLCDWLKNLAPLSRPIRSKTQINRHLLARVFPCLELVTCICFEFWLVHWVICVCGLITLVLVLRYSFEKCSNSSITKAYVSLRHSDEDPYIPHTHTHTHAHNTGSWHRAGPHKLNLLKPDSDGERWKPCTEHLN